MDVVNYDKDVRSMSPQPGDYNEESQNEFDLLQKRLDLADVETSYKSARSISPSEKVASVDGTTLLASTTKNQWAVLPNDTFTAIGATVSHLPPAIYTLTTDGHAIFFNKTKVLTDNLIELDDSAALKIIAGIEKFWESKAKFDRFGILFKRGILMWGPAGSGKTATVNMLMTDLVKRGDCAIASSCDQRASRTSSHRTGASDYRSARRHRRDDQ